MYYKVRLDNCQLRKVMKLLLSESYRAEANGTINPEWRAIYNAFDQADEFDPVAENDE